MATRAVGPTEQRVLDLIVNRGAANKEIARSLGIAEPTVKVHVKAILRKFGVSNRTQLAIAATNGRGAEAVAENSSLVRAIDRAIEFSAFRAAEPFTIRLTFANDVDRLAAANAIDAAIAKSRGEA